MLLPNAPFLLLALNFSCWAHHVVWNIPLASLGLPSRQYPLPASCHPQPTCFCGQREETKLWPPGWGVKRTETFLNMQVISLNWCVTWQRGALHIPVSTVWGLGLCLLSLCLAPSQEQRREGLYIWGHRGWGKDPTQADLGIEQSNTLLLSWVTFLMHGAQVIDSFYGHLEGGMEWGSNTMAWDEEVYMPRNRR